MLCRRDNEASEKKAIDILVKAYKESDEYSYRQRAEDIRIRQLRRKAARRSRLPATRPGPSSRRWNC